MKSVITGAGRVLYSVVIFLLTTVASRYFQTSDYALFREFYMYLLIGISISAFAGVNALFYFRHRSFKSALKIFILAVIFYLMIFAILFAIKRNYSVFVNIIIFPSLLSYMLFEASLISNGKQKTAFFLNVFESVTFALPLFGSMYLNGGMDMYLKILSFVFIIKLPVYLFLIYVETKDGRREYSLKEEVKYTSPLFLNGFFGAVSRQSDKYLVSLLFSKEVFAGYSSGAFEIPLVSRFVTGYFHSHADDMRSKMEDGEYENIRKFFAKSADTLFLLLGFATALLIANSRQVIELLYTAKYADSYIYFSIYLIVFPLRLIPFGFIMSMYGKTKELFFLSLVDAAVTLILSIILLSIYGPAGAAVAYVLATILQVLLMLYVLRKIYPVRRVLVYYTLMSILFILEIYLTGRVTSVILNLFTLLYVLIFMPLRRSGL